MKNTRELWSLKIANYIAGNSIDWSDEQYEKLFNNITIYMKQDNTVINPVEFFYEYNNTFNKLADKIVTFDHTKITDLPVSRRTIVKEIHSNLDIITDNIELEKKKQAAIEEYNKRAEEQGWTKINQCIPTAQFEYKEDEFDNETGLDARQTKIRKLSIEAGMKDPFDERIARWKKLHNYSNNE